MQETAINRVALLLREMGERKGVFSLFLREKAAQPDSGVPSPLSWLQGSKAQGLLVMKGFQDIPNLNILTETRDLVPSCSRPMGACGCHSFLSFLEATKQ